MRSGGSGGIGWRGVRWRGDDWRAAAAPLAALLALSVGGMACAAASDKVYTVGSYPVEATAKDAVTAKDRAMTDGQQAAFRSLLKRIVPVTAYDRIKRLKTVKAADLVDGVAIRSERNSSTRYIASLDFSFQPDGVRTLLRREGIPFVDRQAPGIVLVPIVREAADVPRTASAAWTDAWKALDLVNTLTPARLEAPKAEVHADTWKLLADGTGGAERIVAGEYKAELVVAALVDIDAAGRRLHVTLAGRDAVGPLAWRRSYRMAPGDLEYAMELASIVALGVLEGRWKAVEAGLRGGVEAMAEPGQELRVEIAFQSLAQWNDMRAQLLETDGVEDVRIDGVSARSAEVSLRFPGGAERLADALASKGMALRDEGGIWVVRPRF